MKNVYGSKNVLALNFANASQITKIHKTKSLWQILTSYILAIWYKHDGTAIYINEAEL